MTAMHNIFLIGLSGSGKSTVGRILAHKLNKPFFDLDALIERECGESISTIFARFGIVTKEENRSLMRTGGVCVYLQADPETVLERLHTQSVERLKRGELPEIRPLLAGSDPLKALQQLLGDRSKWYEDAHFTCSTEGKSAERVAEKIIAMFISSGELVEEPHNLFVRHINVGRGYNVVVDWGGLGRRWTKPENVGFASKGLSDYR